MNEMYIITPAESQSEKARNFFTPAVSRFREVRGTIEISQPINVDRPAIIVIESARKKWFIK